MTVNETVEEFFLVCRQALAESGDAGNEVLTQLGWWELPAAFDDPEARGALFALFRAAGRENADGARAYPGDRPSANAGASHLDDLASG